MYVCMPAHTYISVVVSILEQLQHTVTELAHNTRRYIHMYVQCMSYTAIYTIFRHTKSVLLIRGRYIFTKNTVGHTYIRSVLEVDIIKTILHKELSISG